MALNYRTPGEVFCNFLSQKHTESISSVNIDRFSNVENRLANFFSYSMTERKKKILTDFGIYLSPFSWQTHSHPACKTIENELLFVNIYHFVHNNPSSKFVFLSLRDSKLASLKGLFPKPKKKMLGSPDDPVFEHISSINRCLVVKDSFRYGVDLAPSLKGVFHSSPDLVGLNYIVHDELHYWSPVDLNNFICHNDPNTIVGTVVHPIELDSGFSKSMMPELYEFCIRGESLFFFPDGNKSEAYEQPRTAGWWLHCKSFKSNGHIYGLTVLRSIGPFHLIMLKKNVESSESTRFFNHFSCVNFSKGLKKRASDFADTRLKGDTFRKIVRYVLSLKKPDKESVMAKLRMMDDETSDLDESILCSKIVNSLLKDKVLENFDVGVSDWLVAGLKDCFPETFQSLFMSSYFKKKNNLEILMELKELEVEIECKSFDQNYNHGSYIISILNKFTSEAAVESLDMVMFKNYSGIKKDFPCRSRMLFGDSSGYSGVLTEDGYVDGTLVLHFEEFAYAVENSTDYVYDKDLDVDYFNIEKAFLMNDKVRLEEARKESYNCHGCFLSDRYMAFVVKDEDTVFYKSGYKVCLIPLKTINGFGLNANYWVAIIIHFGLYCPNKQIENRCAGQEARRLELLSKVDSLSFLYLTHFPANRDEDETGPSLNDIPEAQEFGDDEVPLCLSNWSGFVNNCCFAAVLEAMKVQQEEFFLLVSKVGFLKLLMLDIGLLPDQFFEFLAKLNLNCIVINTLKTKLFEVDTGIGDCHLFELSDNHCVYIGSAQSSEVLQKQFSLDPCLHGGTEVSDLTDVGALHSAGAIKKLVDCFLNGHTGIFVKGLIEKRREDKKKRPCFWLSKLPDKKERLANLISSAWGLSSHVAILGAAGSGKSNSLIKSVQEGRLSESYVLFVSPRKMLRDDLAGKFEGNKSVECHTFEKALSLPHLHLFDVIVLDELGLYPPGYTDLLVLLSSIDFGAIKAHNVIGENMVLHSHSFFYLGDFAQCRYYGENDSPRLSKEDELERVSARAGQLGVFHYKNYSWRNPVSFPINLGHENLGLGESRKPRFFINCEAGKIAIPDAKVLVASNDEVNKFKKFQASTFGSTQGMSFESVLFCLSPATLSCSSEAIYVGLSRSKGTIDFFFHGFTSKDEFIERSRGTSLNGVLAVGGYDFVSMARSHFERNCKVRVMFEGRKGLSQLDIEEKLAGDPYLKSIVPLLEPVSNYVEPCYVNKVDPANPKIHLPIWEKGNYCADVTMRMKNRELREFKTEKSMSEQFPDFFKKGEPQSLLPGPCRFQGIYPKHSNSDPLTFFAAVKKRLKFSSPAKEREKFENVLHLGEEMFHVFLERIKLDPKIDKNMFEESQQEYLAKKVSKSGPTIASHVSRSEPDWGKHEIFLFIKTQLCTKYEKRFCDAKAGQTLACFAHKLLNRFAAPCRYLEKKIQQALPPNFYIHQKKDFNQLNQWVVDHKFDGVCTESDYEAFDSSQDALILAMEYALLKFIQWDRDLIEDYLDMKFNLGCRLGNLAVMRFTGEFGTFLLNTVCNMAFTFMTYEIKPGTAIAFAGDDMCANKPLVEFGSDGPYSHILNRLTLKAKVDRTRNPTFCGWRLTKHGLYKRPELVLDRLMISEEKGNLHETLDGYLLEFSYAYKLGDWLFDSFSEKEFEAHYICTRLFVKNRHRISRSLHIFVDKICDPDLRIGKCQLLKPMNSSKVMQVGRKGWIACTQTEYTRIQALHLPSFSMLCREMKAQYQSKAQRIQGALSLGFLSYTRIPSMKREGRQSSSGLILEPYQLASTNLDIMILSQPLEPYSLLMAGKKVEDVLLKLMILISQRNPPISCLLPMHVLTYMMNFSSGLVKFTSSSMKTFMMRGPGLLALSLGRYSDSRMHLIVFTHKEMSKQANSVGIIRPFSTLLAGTCQSMMKLVPNTTMSTSGLACFSPNQVVSQNLLKEKEVSSEEEDEAPPSFWSLMLFHQPIRTFQACQGPIQLGQICQSLMNIEALTAYWIIQLELPLTLCGKMSDTRSLAKPIKDWVNNKARFAKRPPDENLRRVRRRMLLRTYWVLNLHKSFPKLGQDPSKWTPEQNSQYAKIADDFAAYAFGSMSIYGFSESTIYPSSSISYEIEYDEPIIKVNVAFKLDEVKHAFKYYVDQSDQEELEGMTWRQVGESFAEDIRIYLRDIMPDARTWLAKSNPILAGNAHWVATDVTAGLWKPLSPQEKKVITLANNHLLKTLNLKSKFSEGDLSTVET